VQAVRVGLAGPGAAGALRLVRAGDEAGWARSLLGALAIVVAVKARAGEAEAGSLLVGAWRRAAIGVALVLWARGAVAIAPGATAAAVAGRPTAIVAWAAVTTGGAVAAWGAVIRAASAVAAIGRAIVPAVRAARRAA